MSVACTRTHSLSWICCRRRMESLESISPLTVRLVFHLFLYFEMSLHVVGFVVSSIFFIVFSRLRSIHTNLIIILDSFVLSFCVTSVWRVYYCLKLLILNIEPGDSALTLGTDMRDTCMYVGEWPALFCVPTTSIAFRKNDQLGWTQVLAQSGF